jgi:hypothetical protein
MGGAELGKRLELLKIQWLYQSCVGALAWKSVAKVNLLTRDRVVSADPRIVVVKRCGIGGARNSGTSKLCQMLRLSFPDNSAIRRRKEEKMRQMLELLEEDIFISRIGVVDAFGEGKLVSNLDDGNGAVAKHMGGQQARSEVRCRGGETVYVDEDAE